MILHPFEKGRFQTKFFLNLLDRLDCVYNKCSQIDPTKIYFRFSHFCNLVCFNKRLLKRTTDFLGRTNFKVKITILED
jgi:hypothetical protein